MTVNAAIWESPVLGLEHGFPLHAMVTSCGVAEASSADYRFDGSERGDRSFAVLQYTLAGEGVLTYEGVEHILGEGSLMSVSIPHNHVYEFRSGRPWRFIYVCVTGSEALRAVRAVTRPVHQVDRHSALTATMLEIIDRVKREHLPSPYALSGAAYTLAMELLSVSQLRRADPRNTELVQTARRMMEENADRPLSVSEVGLACGMSRAHFTRVFRESAGITPRRYLEEVRIHRAIDLLYSSSLSIKEIGFACGYPDPHYFSKAFKRRTGTTPGAYRLSRM